MISTNPYFALESKKASFKLNTEFMSTTKFKEQDSIKIQFPIIHFNFNCIRKQRITETPPKLSNFALFLVIANVNDTINLT